MTKKYTKEFLISELHRFYKQNGRIPKQRDMCGKNGYISFVTYQDYFGTWNNALIESGFQHNRFVGYTKEILIQELKRFYEENGRVPTRRDMTTENGYPTASTYVIYFGSWNNGLIASGLDINKQGTYNNEPHVCKICGSTKAIQWYRKDGNIICLNCYQTDRACVNGTLDPNCTTGIGFITEHVVYKVLGDCIQCNTVDNFCASYDFISEVYGTINVKSSKLKNTNNSWLFSKLQNSYIPDNYVCIGFNEDSMIINYVWIIPKNIELIKPYGISITNSKRGLSRVQQYEVDPTPYNKVYQNLDIYSLPEFCNLPRDECK